MLKTFNRYRIMSFITGTTLLTLCATLILHKVDATAWHHIKWFVNLVGVGHGIVLYPIYLVASFNLALKAKLHVGYIAIMLLSGFVPGLAFYMEYRMEKKLFPQGRANA
jgi:integral membrane protein